MKTKQFNFFLLKNAFMLKSSNTDGNTSGCASDIISVVAKYSSG